MLVEKATIIQIVLSLYDKTLSFFNNLVFPFPGCEFFKFLDILRINYFKEIFLNTNLELIVLKCKFVCALPTSPCLILISLFLSFFIA